ncbi:hypothetical protein IAU60_000445 [Kwoniella sp. DSM 27419]
MSEIQDITIISTKTVDQPKPHTVYVIQISTPIRTWTVSRRYSDFVSLHAELKSSTGKEPPGTLPAKGWRIGLGLGRSAGDEKTIRERRVLLEQYLRLILTSKDSTWRQSYGFKDFLSVPSTQAGSSSAAGGGSAGSQATWTAQSWLLEHTSLQGVLRSARSSLLKRDALAGMGDPVASRSAAVEAKKLLKDCDARIGALDSALGNLTLGEGEKKRREEMVQGLKVEREGLGRMAEAGVRSSGFRDVSSGPAGTGPGAASSAFAPGNTSSAGGSLNSLPGTFPHVQTGRVFGARAPPQETTETRPLGDRGLLQLQATKMDGQDEQLRELSKILNRQRQMGEEIHQEIGEQNDLLDEIESGVDKTGRKLGKAKRQLNRLG